MIDYIYITYINILYNYNIYNNTYIIYVYVDKYYIYTMRYMYIIPTRLAIDSTE